MTEGHNSKMIYCSSPQLQIQYPSNQVNSLLLDVFADLFNMKVAPVKDESRRGQDREERICDKCKYGPGGITRPRRIVS